MRTSHNAPLLLPLRSRAHALSTQSRNEKLRVRGCCVASGRPCELETWGALKKYRERYRGHNGVSKFGRGRGRHWRGLVHHGAGMVAD
jgi:hypothetical protein